MIFGLDLGYGNIKLYGAAGGVVLPSRVAVAGRAAVNDLAGMNAAEPPLKITTSGRSYYVGDRAHEWGRPIESLDYERLAGSPEIIALTYAAFTRYLERENIPEGTGIGVMVGLPLQPLSGERDEVEGTLAAVRKWMRGVHVWQVDGRTYRLNIEDVRLTSQTTGALFDYLLDGDGRFIPERANQVKEEIGIISTGFNTVELQVVRNTAPVQRFTAGATVGVRRLLELINNGDLWSLGELDGQLRAGALNTRDALPVWAREVQGQIEHVWGRQWERFAHIIIVGGGAVLLNGYLTPRFKGKAAMPDEPIQAVARGLYKLGLLQEQQKRGRK
ncbi:MAG: ParM/StbA family protein [Anaerolineae bacterium]|nr:ParM/StbA family protein [Anaerolineae bacterium]